MSHSSHSHYEHSGSAAASRPQSAAIRLTPPAPLARQALGDYTLVHAGRQVRIGPVAFWIVVGTLVIMGVWSIATGTYFAFRDDVLTRLIGRQADMQFAYEDRIAELRAQVDRITSRQLLDQEQFEQKLQGLLRRQATLEQRTSALTGDALTTGSIKPSRIAPPRRPPRAGRSNPRRSTTPSFSPRRPTARPDLESRELAANTTRFASGVDAGGLDRHSCARLIVARQGRAPADAALTDMEEQVDTKARRIRGVLADLGVNVGKGSAGSGIGGPFVPLKAPRSRRQRFRAPALPHQCRARADRPLHPDAGRRAGAQAGRRRGRHEFALRHAHGPVPRRAGDPYRHRSARRHRRSGARHRQRHASPSPAGTAATATWSRSTTATACRPATATCRRST